MIPSDVTLPEVIEHYEEKLGRKSRFLDLATQEISEHPDF